MLDIQTIIDIIQSNIIIPVSVSLLIGIIGSWLLLRPKVSKRDKYITELEKSTKKNAKQLKNQNESITQYETTVETLNNELSDRENTIEDRENTIENAREKINELSARAKEIIFAKDRHIETLNTSLADKDKNFTKLTKRAQMMESNEKKGRLELTKQMKTITGLQSQLVERSDQMASLKEEITDLNNLMQKNIGERDSQIDTLSDTVETNNERIGILTERLQVKDEAIQSKQDQISKKEDDIQELKDKFNEQSLYIKNMTEEKTDLQDQIQKIVTRAEGAEAREIEMGTALKSKDIEYASIHQRTRRMQDDFTHLAGIGQKTSSILKNAGIKSFSKLAETEVKHINEILEKKNQSLLKKSDPATWPEQARIAAAGDWEALTNLKNSIKAAKS